MFRRVERQDDSYDCLSLFFRMFHVKHNVKSIKKTHKMKTELYIKKNSKDSFDLIKGPFCWKKISAFQVYSWIADESKKVLPIGVRGKGKFKITIEQIE